MRLPDVERGDGLGNRLLIRFISAVAGMRLPDAARVAFYHRDFFGTAMGRWTQRVMRGPSAWTVGERELMAAMVARWNSCTFCIGAHSAIARKRMDAALVDAALADYRAAPLADALKAALAFLEVMALRPEELSGADARAALQAGVSAAALKDAIAVGAVFGIVTRYADALGFAIPSQEDFDKSADMLLRRGYGR
jgi:uncharacterized peroxidase-related enzyme